MRLVVFDCDGTLVDSQRLIIEAMHRAFAAEGLALPEPQAIRHIVGLALDKAMTRLCDEIDHSTCVRLVDGYKAAFTELRKEPVVRETLFPGAREALDRTEAAGCLLGIATGKSRRGLAATLEHHDLTSYFMTVQTADDAPSKPHPEMLHRAMAEAGAHPQETALIGDTVYDIEMAANAGVAAVGVAWGYHEVGALHAAGAHRVIEDFRALPAALLGKTRSG